MVWKDWPYWLKGGVIFSLVIFTFIFLKQAITGSCSAFVIEKSCSVTEALILPLLLIIPAFVLGMIIGWTVGKFKSKNT